MIGFLLNPFSSLAGQQIPDTSYNPPIRNPAYATGSGPRVGIDEAHHNFHTGKGRYQPFARLLRRDGYDTERLRKSLSAESLKHLDVVVIANPLNKINQNNWQLPTPSAFTERELEALHTWVKEGNSLLLIADHMPFPGAAEDLALSFGFTFSNGFARLGNHNQESPDVFERASGLMDCAVTSGRNESEQINQVVTFTGSAFQVPKEAIPVLVFPRESVSREPEEAWKFSSQTPEVSIEGWCQGALLEFGEGRVAVFGEAAMFTAQWAGSRKRSIGMSAPYAEQNYQFLLNVMHWLSRLEEME